MKRRLFNILAAFSLLLCVATVVLWVRSGTTESFGVGKEGTCCLCLHSSKGSVEFQMYAFTRWLGVGSTRPVGPREWFFSHIRDGRIGYVFNGWANSRESRDWTWGNVADYSEAVKDGRVVCRIAFFALPHWISALMFLVLPVLWAWRAWRRRHGAKVGHCLKCGYDLRASKERCPECGTPIATKAEAKA